MNNKKTIFLISGKKRSGKNFVGEILAEVLAEQEKEVFITHFADPMKRIIAKTFDITLEELDEYKNCDDVDIIITEVYNSDFTPCPFHETNFRRVLQRFGTEAMKPEFGEDVWSSLCEKNISEQDKDYVIIPDFRFETEYSCFVGANKDKYNVISIKIINPDEDLEDSHSSESSLEDFRFDYTYSNPKVSEEELPARRLEIKTQIKNILRELQL